MHFQGVFYAIVIYGQNVLRVCFGSLPIFLCNIAGFLNGCALLFVAIIVVMNTLTRFMFVCIWKRMKQMDDNLIARIATIQAIFISILFNAASWLQLQHQLTIPVSFSLLFFVGLDQALQILICIIKFTSSGLYWNSAISKIVNISIHPIFLPFHCNWINDCNTKEMSY